MAQKLCVTARTLEGRELYENVEKYISKLFSTEQQPTASEILSGIENTLGIISI